MDIGSDDDDANTFRINALFDGGTRGRLRFFRFFINLLLTLGFFFLCFFAFSFSSFSELWLKKFQIFISLPFRLLFCPIKLVFLVPVHSCNLQRLPPRPPPPPTPILHPTAPTHFPAMPCSLDPDLSTPQYHTPPLTLFLQAKTTST